MKVIVYRDKSGDWRWKLVAENGEVIADSGEGYRNKNYAIKQAKKINTTAELVIEE